MRHYRAALLCVLATVACEVTDPTLPSSVEFHVVSPHGAEGAALIELVGESGTVAPRDDGHLLTARRGDTVWVFVALQVPGEIRFAFEVAARRQPPSARVVEVADGENRMRPDVDAYQVRLVR
ncbi:MAG TPA: hypothetical protein VGA37_17255 [Gemmatimonadales bacterium]